MYDEDQHPHAASSLTPERLAELQQVDRLQAKGTHEGREYSVRSVFNPDAPLYPKIGTHLWSAFPVVAIETGGYNDIEARNPFTGQLLWMADANWEDGPYNALRRLIDVMEAARFLDGNGETEPAPTSRT